MSSAGNAAGPVVVMIAELRRWALERSGSGSAWWLQIRHAAERWADALCGVDAEWGKVSRVGPNWVILERAHTGVPAFKAAYLLLPRDSRDLQIDKCAVCTIIGVVGRILIGLMEPGAVLRFPTQPANSLPLIDSLDLRSLSWVSGFLHWVHRSTSGAKGTEWPGGREDD